MSIALLVAVAAITVVSRIAALAVLPPPRGAVADMVQRLPAPLFAALAALSLAGSDGGVTNPPLIAAVCCALVSTRWSSLLITLLAGLGGFAVASLIW
jgi:branched-subunit amino acid transport protein